MTCPERRVRITPTNKAIATIVAPDRESNETTMSKTKLLNGLPHDLVHSFFSTLRYWEKGYMSDWIVNACKDLKTDKIEIDILNKKIEPYEIEIEPIMCNLKELDKIIVKALNHAGFENNFLTKACFEIVILENRFIKCHTLVIGENGKTLQSHDYYEKSYEEFKALNLNLLDKFLNWKNKWYFRLKYKLLGRYAFRKLKFTKRLENMMN
jgi:hypothetical protein